MGTALVYVGLQLPVFYQTFTLLIFAYVLRFIPLGITSVRNSLESMDNSPASAARTLGAGPAEIFRRVTLPQGRKVIIRSCTGLSRNTERVTSYFTPRPYRL